MLRSRCSESGQSAVGVWDAGRRSPDGYVQCPACGKRIKTVGRHVNRVYATHSFVAPPAKTASAS